MIDINSLWELNEDETQHINDITALGIPADNGKGINDMGVVRLPANATTDDVLMMISELVPQHWPSFEVESVHMDMPKSDTIGSITVTLSAEMARDMEGYK